MAKKALFYTFAKPSYTPTWRVVAITTLNDSTYPRGYWGRCESTGEAARGKSLPYPWLRFETAEAAEAVLAEFRQIVARGAEARRKASDDYDKALQAAAQQQDAAVKALGRALGLLASEA